MFRIKYLAGISGLIMLSGCSLNIGTSLFGSSAPHAYAVGDTSYVTQTGTAILAQGGNAADAATAMFFTLAVTDPAQAGLGGGGVCLVHNPKDGSNTEYAFLPKAVSGSSYAIPAAVNGFAGLQHKYGRIKWTKTVSTAESYALTGFPMTETLHKALAAHLDKIRLDATLAQEFLDENGQLKPVGTRLIAEDLGHTLTRLREIGPQEFYRGGLAQKISAYSQITPQALAAYRTMNAAPLKMDVNGETVWVPSAKSGAGAYTRTLLTKTADTEHKSAFITALKQLKTTTGSAYGSTGFAVVDADGMSVTCSVTMNAPLGAARTVPGTGITLATPRADGHAYLSPVIAAGSSDSSTDFAGAAAGGPAGNASVTATLIRFSHDDMIYDRKQMDSFGNHPGDLANVILCDGNDCVALPDPSGEGLGEITKVPKIK